MVKRTSKYHPRRISRYVPGMQYTTDIVHLGPHRVDFGKMAVADVDLILDGTTVTGGIDTTTFLVDNTDPVVAATATEFPNGPGFGRCLQIVFSAAGTPAVNIYGRDYLGQPMRETFTGNGTTPVIGVKAFKYIDRIVVASGVTGTIDVGTTDKLGLPYRMSNVLAEELDDVRVATLGTLVTPSLTDPQTATTTDPRGTYDPQSTLDGSAHLAAYFLTNGDLNSSGNGGLHGLAHYYA
jgi:hypothetical protein